MLVVTVALRALQEEDWPALVSCLGDVETVRYTEFEPFTEAEARWMIRWASEKQREEPQASFVFGVTLPPDGAVVGVATLTVREPALREADIGFILGREHWKKGFATATVRELLAVGFGRIGLHRIFGECDPANYASACVMEKAGMAYEGHLRECRQQKGRWVDRLLYAVLDRDRVVIPRGLGVGETAPSQEELLGIAGRLADAYVSRVAACAVAVTGSVALDIADEASDIDLIVLHGTIPDRAALDAVRAHVSGSPRIYASALRDEARFKEGYFVEGVRCDISHVTVAALGEDMAAVLDTYSTDAHAQSRVSGIVDTLPLRGAEILGGFKDAASRYPDGLARAMVEKHLSFQPFWVLTEMGVRRGELPYLYQTMVEAEKNILGTLCGLNRVYFPGEVKHLDRLAAKLRLAPPDLGRRLRAVLRREPKAAVEELGALIRETFALVGQHMPEADTSWPLHWFELPQREASETLPGLPRLGALVQEV